MGAELMGVQEQAAGTISPTPPVLCPPGPHHCPGQPNRHTWVRILPQTPFLQPPTPSATAPHIMLSDEELAITFIQHWVLVCLLHELHWVVEKTKKINQKI